MNFRFDLAYAYAAGTLAAASCSGTYRFEPRGAGARRLIEGDLRVKAPLVERFLASR